MYGSLYSGLPGGGGRFVKCHEALIHVSETDLCYGLNFPLHFLPPVRDLLALPLPVTCPIRRADASIAFLSACVWQDQM